MHIRPATIADSDALGLIIVSATHATFLGRVPEADIDFTWTPAVSAYNWRASFAEDPAMLDHFYVAERAAEVVGFAWAAPAARMPAKPRTAGILKTL